MNPASIPPPTEIGMHSIAAMAVSPDAAARDDDGGATHRPKPPPPIPSDPS